MKKMNLNTFAQYFPPRLTETLLIMGIKDMQEIRINAERNASVLKNGNLLDTGVFIKREELSSIINAMCRGSMYAMQNSLSKGYITLQGGHRVGICGKCITENGEITHITDISSACIRISRAVYGAADGIMEYLDFHGKLYNALIISPPGCGKTTVLRDAIRQLGNRYRVCVADERSEIASCKNGVPSHDVGKFTSVMDAVPKAKGMMMLLRSMSPQIIATDETGSYEEEEAIYRIINAGAKILTTAHGYNERDILNRKYLGNLLERGVFERIFVLSNRKSIGTVEKIITDGKVMRHN
ncbi:MAG: stage III sporulation protein AA [Ruminococcaceae bacterium]|nr:stage III sporulation protein AA [Oscillospiraceae bacterium]